MSRLALGMIVLVACAAPQPELRTYALEEVRASYRAYAAPLVCESEPHWIFDELTSVNQLLASFLERCGARSGATEHGLDLLRTVLPTLPAVVETHASNLNAVAACPYAQEGLFPELLRNGQSLTAESREFLARAPAMVSFAHTAEALVQWRKDLPARQEAARASCPSTPTGPPTVYFAWRDEILQTTWLFCDGSRIATTDTGGGLSFDGPPGATAEQRKRLDRNDYAVAAKVYPEQRILRAPER